MAKSHNSTTPQQVPNSYENDSSSYTFEQRDYLKFMPVVQTDQFSHRLHYCPICGERRWSVWANADKHWQKHGQEAM